MKKKVTLLIIALLLTMFMGNADVKAAMKFESIKNSSTVTIRTLTKEGGAGDATFITVKNGSNSAQRKNILIDTGVYNNKMVTNLKDTVAYNATTKTVTLDYLIITHGHGDHVNGLVYIMENISTLGIEKINIANMYINLTHYDTYSLIRNESEYTYLKIIKDFLSKSYVSVTNLYCMYPKGVNDTDLTNSDTLTELSTLEEKSNFNNIEYCGYFYSNLSALRTKLNNKFKLYYKKAIQTIDVFDVELNILPAVNYRTPFVGAIDTDSERINLANMLLDAYDEKLSEQEKTVDLSFLNDISGGKTIVDVNINNRNDVIQTFAYFDKIYSGINISNVIDKPVKLKKAFKDLYEKIGVGQRLNKRTLSDAKYVNNACITVVINDEAQATENTKKKAACFKVIFPGDIQTDGIKDILSTSKSDAVDHLDMFSKTYTYNSINTTYKNVIYKASHHGKRYGLSVNTIKKQFYDAEKTLLGTYVKPLMIVGVVWATPGPNFYFHLMHTELGWGTAVSYTNSFNSNLAAIPLPIKLP